MNFECVIVFFVILLAMPLSVVAQQSSEVQWKEYNGVSIPIPPSEHPRLYVREQHIPELEKRFSDPVLKKVWRDLEEMSQDERSEDDGEEKDWRYYVQQRGASVQAEMDALLYLVHKDTSVGRGAITTALDLMRDGSWPEIQDIARASGRLMVTGAIVYDWCYDLLEEEEKAAFVEQFIRLAKTLECGYPPVKQGAINGHSAEWMISRDLLSAAIAIYDEYPEMYHLTAERFFAKHVPVRNWFYPGQAYHQGSGYDKVRLSSDLYPLWIFDRMGAGNIFHPDQQFIPYSFFYRRRGDGQFLLSGDVNPSRGRRARLGLLAMLCGAYYQDEYTNYEFLQRPSIDSRDKFFEFLWRDTELGQREPSDLPLSRYFGFPFGWAIARTGWDENSVVAEMKINVYNFINHQHHDAGAFQIYYKGPLAIDSGAYTGSSGGYNSQHNKNYFKRTIAHNSLLVYDPDEVFETNGYGGADKTPFGDNDGGQRLNGDQWGAPQDLEHLLAGDYKTGDILAHGAGPDDMVPDYTYLKGDITEAYSDKVSAVRRSFCFLNLKEETVPGALIVFDKVVSSNAEFKKCWLLHSIEAPEIKDNQVTITRTQNGDTGKLVNATLLPKMDDVEITPVGGEGKEFWVFGKNYENDPTNRPDVANERGAWRVEVSPKNPATENYFLNVMQVMNNTNENVLEVEMIENDWVVGACIKDRIVAFSKTSDVLDQSYTLSVEGEGMFKIMLTDMHEGAWQIQKEGEVFKADVSVEVEDRVLYFEGSAGEYTFLR
ncbi:MAG: heparinase [Candidatus Latescibacteria bacterium]|nr:heparinase [Candidatus Latescibacterota bacterium]MBT5830614.1 heparinase [Candidatus Latescibacterota bacterium]